MFMMITTVVKDLAASLSCVLPFSRESITSRSCIRTDRALSAEASVKQELSRTGISGMDIQEFDASSLP